MTARLEWQCHVCGGLSLKDGEDGSYYCSRCNSQADVVDTGVDDDVFANFDGGIYSVTHRRARSSQTVPADIISQLSAPPTLNFDSQEGFSNLYTCNVGDNDELTGPSDFGSYSKALSYDDYYSAIRLRYVMGFQVMVQLQCKALVEDLNVSPLIVGLVGPIWLRFLAFTGIMADGWADKAVHESESQLQGEASESQGHAEYRNEPHNMLGKRAVTIWYKSLRTLMPLPYSLAISFLVCHLARESVLPTDIIKWTIEGKLPYFAAFLEIEKQLGPPSSACPISSSRMFRPIQVIPAQKLESLAAFIAQEVGLELPPVHFYGIASRFLNHLSVPVERILPQALRIYEWATPPELYLSANKSSTPTRVCVMAILIVTIRIIFDLNGYGKWEMNLTGSRNSPYGASKIGKDLTGSTGIDIELSSDGSDYDIGLEADQGMKFDGVDLLKILEKKCSELNDKYEYSADLTSYLQYCKDVVFAGSGSSFEDYEEEKLMEDLWSLYQNQKDIKEDNIVPSISVSDQDKISEENEASMPRGNRGNMDPTEKSKSVQNQFMNVVDTSTSEWPKSSDESQFLSLKDESIRLLKLDMDDNKFCYIPPRRRVKNSTYLVYSRKKIKGAYVYAAHADYYILLRACARVVQVDLRTLHCAVLDFERRLKRLEDRIGSCLRMKAGNFSEIAEIAEDDCTDLS